MLKIMSWFLVIWRNDPSRFCRFLKPHVNIQSVSGESRYAVGIQRKAVFDVFDGSLFVVFMCNLNSICAWNQKTNLEKQSRPTLTCRFIPNRVDILFLLLSLVMLQAWKVMFNVGLRSGEKGDKAISRGSAYKSNNRCSLWPEKRENTEKFIKKATLCECVNSLFCISWAQLPESSGGCWQQDLTR